MTRITPGPFQGFGRNNGGNGGNKARFMPGQIGGMTNDLQAGYGGSDEKWKKYLRGVYDPVSLSGGFNFGGNRGNGGGKNDPRNDPRTGPDGGTRPDVIGNPHSMMPMQMPQMGLLSSPMQQPQQPQRGLLGDIDPQILAYLTRR